ncbi:olfactory receptor 6F1-like [Microcaecilia unicolor]|uniref:Olfactory receptor n=1 Tax=Microcaecilia unicolor TaxID=1415580 RepID=A0A6P7WGL5_9AMPH|nr:olfactory receptor 6F1-like [Microcaecilia unicolor]
MNQPWNLKNHTDLTHLLLLGFPSTRKLEVLLFVIFSLIYTLTLLANFLIILTVGLDWHLHKPMYFFISNLAFLEVWYTTVVTPKMLAGLLTHSKSISVTSCIIQLYFFFSLGSTECLLLAAMAFDRYLAICNPLRYAMILNSEVCCKLASTCWLVGFLTMLFPVTLMFRLSFCGPSVLNHFFCDADPLLRLSCTDTKIIELINFILAVAIVISSFSLTMVSYFYIILTILSISSATGRQKAFSTCTSHLLIVSLFYVTVSVMYVRPSARYSVEMDKMVSMWYAIVTPLINPFIYTLRNRDVKDALRHMLTGKTHCRFQ